MPGTVEKQRYVGREGIETYAAELGDMWQEFHLSPDKFHELDDRVVMLGWVKAQSIDSANPLVAPIGWDVEFRGGEFSLLHGYLAHGDTLRAAGLTE